MFRSAESSSLSPGAWVIVALAASSAVVFSMRPTAEHSGLRMWIRARAHQQLYRPLVAAWNAEAPVGQRVQLSLMSDVAIERRILAGFLADVPVADLVELERRNIGRIFNGPVESVGFLDLTERLRASGWLDEINQPSLSPWMRAGRIFGLPHDVHPVLLVYRADLVEEAGIDVSTIETWDDFVRVLAPLRADLDGDGTIDRYLLNVWHTNADITECLLRQAGGGYFDTDGKLTIESAVNARCIARIVTWVCGPERIAIDAQEFTATGNQIKLAGNVVASLAPDWLCGLWKQDMPALKGTLRLMPLPAWEPGGRRTSAWGGSMLGIARQTDDPDAAWAFAQQLYLSRAHAEQLYHSNGIISPIKRYWSESFYAEPDPYFSGQAPGAAYIAVAEQVPPRPSSPYNQFAKGAVQNAVAALREHAVAHDRYTVEELLPEAQAQLQRAAATVRRQMQRNVFSAEAN